MSKKYLIASDIHGSAYWCKILLETFENTGADTLVLLGDILYHGPRNPLPDGYAPQEVFAMLNKIKHKIVCVRGNCDSEVDQMVLEFPIMADYAWISDGDMALFATHGHLFNTQTPPLLKKGQVLLNGHFHTPTHVEMENGALYANCGSVALPKDGTPHSCILAENNELTWLDLETGGMFDYLRIE